MFQSPNRLSGSWGRTRERSELTTRLTREIAAMTEKYEEYYQAKFCHARAIVKHARPMRISSSSIYLSVKCLPSRQLLWWWRWGSKPELDISNIQEKKTPGKRYGDRYFNKLRFRSIPFQFFTRIQPKKSHKEVSQYFWQAKPRIA